MKSGILKIQKKHKVKFHAYLLKSKVQWDVVQVCSTPHMLMCVILF